MSNDISGAFIGVLRQAADEFGGHTCNDHYIEDTPANRSLAERIEPEYYGPDAKYPLDAGANGLFVADFLLLDYLVDGLREGRIAIIEKG